MPSSSTREKHRTELRPQRLIRGWRKAGGVYTPMRSGRQAARESRSTVGLTVPDGVRPDSSGKNQRPHRSLTRKRRMFVIPEDISKLARCASEGFTVIECPALACASG